MALVIYASFVIIAAFAAAMFFIGLRSQKKAEVTPVRVKSETISSSSITPMQTRAYTPRRSESARNKRKDLKRMRRVRRHRGQNARSGARS